MPDNAIDPEHSFYCVISSAATLRTVIQCPCRGSSRLKLASALVDARQMRPKGDMKLHMQFA